MTPDIEGETLAILIFSDIIYSLICFYKPSGTGSNSLEDEFAFQILL